MFVDEGAQWLRVVFDRPRSLDRVDVVATPPRPTPGAPDPMHVTSLTAVLSDGTSVPIRLTNGRGSVRLPGVPTDFLELRIEGIAGTDPSPFGLSEVTVVSDGKPLRLHEEIQLPDDVVRRAADSPRPRRALERAPVTYQLARVDPVDGRQVESTIRRRFRTAGTRPYELRGRLADPDSITGADCQDIGVTVDGHPQLVRSGRRGFVGCAPLELAVGWHTLRTEHEPAVRRIWLSSGAPAGGSARSGDDATLASLGRASFDIDATTQGPATIVTGQSADDHWAATIDGRDAGAARSLDTQAAWRVAAAGRHHLDAHQDQQGLYLVALAVTGIGVLLCLVLVVRGRFR